jgi:hypothetical protein
MWRRNTLTVLLAGGLVGCAVTQSASPPSAPSVSARPAAATISAPSAGASSPVAGFAERAAGPGGGWIIGARTNWIDRNRLDLAKRSNDAARQSPASVGSIDHSDDADLNSDGFVTLDEILAMKRAGLSNSTIIKRINETPQVFSINARQEQYLIDRGIDQPVIKAIRAKQKPVFPSAGLIH